MTTKDLLELEQYAPKDWGARVDYDKWSPTQPTNQLFIHWGGPPVREPAAEGNVNSEKAQLRAYEEFHIDKKGWKGLAYDWAIGQSGTLYRVRGLGRSAAQAGDADVDGVDNNLEGEAILCIIGKGQKPSEAMLETLTKVVKTAKPKQLYGHREGRGTKTECPGPELMDVITNLRASGPQKAPVKKTEPKKAAPAPKKNTLETIVADLGTQRLGARNPAVKRIQALLNLTGSFSLRTDGWYGPRTEGAVEEYQQIKKLAQDGVVGPKTWTSLLTSDL